MASPPQVADRKRLLEGFRHMVLVRRFESRVDELRAAGDVPGFVHLAHGAEAICAALYLTLQPGDCLSSSHRCHGHALSLGLDPRVCMAEIMGRRDGLNGGRAGSQHLIAPKEGFLGGNGIVGAGVPLALGAALARKSLGQQGVGVAVFGDGAMNQGVVLESMNLASVLSLPVLFLIEVNGWAQATPTRTVTAGTDLADRPRAFALKTQRVDGRDLTAVLSAVGQAVATVRDGEGPFCLIADITRLSGHHSLDEQGYRADLAPPGDPDHDPLVIARTRLSAEGVDAAVLDQIETDVTDAINKISTLLQETAP